MSNALYSRGGAALVFALFSSQPLLSAAQPATPAVAASTRASSAMNRTLTGVRTLGPVANVEAVHFSGTAQITSRVADDREVNQPMLVLMVDLTGVVGVGTRSRLRYVLTTQEFIVRPSKANHNIEFSFLMVTDETAPIAHARVGNARVVLNVDRASGVATSVAVTLTPRT